MGLLTSLKRAEEQGREAARRSVVRAVDMWEDAERRIRRNMRIHPRLVPPVQRVSSSTAITSAESQRPK
jgi:hypothetical protein